MYILINSTRYFCQTFTKLGLLERFSKKAQISSFIKIRPVAAELFHTGGQTWMKPATDFRNFANAPEN